MWYRLETWADSSYDSIFKEYGEILKSFSIKEQDGKMMIDIDSTDELFRLDKCFRDFGDDIDWCSYFGIMVARDRDGQLICIKDGYD